MFFDSGGTLARPLGDDWWPKPRFAELIEASGRLLPGADQIRSAHDAGAGHLASHQAIPTVDDEVGVYVGFYRIVLAVLYDDAPEDLVYSLAEAAVYELDQEPYDDTRAVLRTLAASGVRMGIVSNAGPSLELRYRDMGLRQLFDPFVISAVVGSEKPGQEIYEIALERAALDPADVVFVDDVTANVAAAAALGMRAYLIDRDGPGDRPDATLRDNRRPVLSDLQDLPAIMEGACVSREP